MYAKSQWTERITQWIQAVKNQIYQPLGEVGTRGFFTKEHLSPQEAAGYVEKDPRYVDKLADCCSAVCTLTAGETWGSAWEYAWFAVSITLGKEAQGRRIVCVPDTGAEALCFLTQEQGQRPLYMPIGAYDKQHKEILLCRSANEGEQYDLLLEAYAGHGARVEHLGPCPPEQEPLPPTPDRQCRMGHITYGIWKEEAYQLYLDAFVLWDTYQVLDPRSLRAMKILEALQKFTKVADVELEEPLRTQSFLQARAVLAEALSCQNGSTAPLMSICGQSHLDLAWLWHYEETRRKCARTYANQLALLEEYPEYRFLACEPIILEQIQKDYPQLYPRIQEQIARGAILPEGGVWVEPDSNIPCGEALLRHLIKGQESFAVLAGAAESETRSRLLWLPDTFGFSAALPQLMKLCGMTYFATQKLLRAAEDTEPFPYQDFIWEGNDGSRVLAHVYKKNNTVLSPSDLHQRWYKDRRQQSGLDGMLYPFGYGDGGGGATRDMVEIARRVENLEGIPRTVMESPAAYFERMEQNDYPKSVYKGELYLAWHRGTYTAQSRIKRGNRLAESALRSAEGALVYEAIMHAETGQTESITANMRSTQEQIKALWDKLLFLQFHDILAGSSIQRVNEEATEDYRQLIDQAVELAAQHLEGLNQNSQWQESNAQRIVSEQDTGCHITQAGTAWILENALIRASIGADGSLISLLCKENGREFLERPSNRLHLYKDVNATYDAWEISNMVWEQECCEEEIMQPAQICVLQEESAQIVLEVRKKLHHSTLVQKISMKAQEPLLFFDTVVDWQERHKLLKVGFYPTVHTRESIQEIAYGYLKRPFGENNLTSQDYYEVPQHRFSALADDNHGFILLNDAKYGIHAADAELSLSLLRAPMAPDATAEAGRHSFAYACMVYNGSFCDSGIMQYASAMQERSLRQYHPQAKAVLSELAGRYIKFLPEESSHVVLDWAKLAEHHENTILLRCYQSMDLEEHVRIWFAFPVSRVTEVTPLEEEIRPLEIDSRSNSVAVTCRPFQVITIACVLGTAQK